MTEQNHSADKSQNNTGAKQKKPTSAYRQLRRKFAKTRLRAPLVWWNHQPEPGRYIQRFLSQVRYHLDTLRIVRNALWDAGWI